jgi:starch synthase (maltosyl-transferring)
MLIRAAATGEGLLVPMGFEFGAEHDMSRRGGKPDDLGDIHLPCVSTLAAEIRNGNALVEQLAKLGVTGAIRTLSDPGQQPTALIRTDTAGIGHTKNAAVVIINPDLQRPAEFRLSLAPLPPSAGAALVADQTLYSESRPADLMNAGEIRIIRAHAVHPMKLPRPKMAPHTVASHRVVIDNVSPAIDRGRFAAKRVIGEPIAIEADVLTDGHELLAAETLWRAIDEKGWRRVPMQHLGNDRWQATILPDRIGRYRFTIEARWDKYGTFCRDLNLKRRAGADITLEISEGCELLKGAHARAAECRWGHRIGAQPAQRSVGRIERIFFYPAIWARRCAMRKSVPLHIATSCC